MIELVFEKVYTQYHCKQKLQALSEYLGKIPGSDNKKFVKMLVFVKGGPAIYNISKIMTSQCIADGTAAVTPGKKKVQIIYTGDESSKAMTMKQFATACKKILAEIENIDEKVDKNEVILEAALEGKESAGHSFRFYYNNSTEFAILVKNANVEGIEEFLNNYEGDLEEAISLPKTRSITGKKNPKPKQKSWKDDYVLVDVVDDCKHKIRRWKRKDMVGGEPDMLDQAMAGKKAQWWPDK